MAMSATQILDAICSLGTTEQRSIHLQMAEERTSPDSFGAKRPFAVAFRAAHELTMLLDPAVSSTGGNIMSKKEGQLSVSYGNWQQSSGAMAESDLSMTSFGRRLMGLIKGNILSVGVTGSQDFSSFEPQIL